MFSAISYLIKAKPLIAIQTIERGFNMMFDLYIIFLPTDSIFLSKPINKLFLIYFFS
jgi:hypothetical protein